MDCDTKNSEERSSRCSSCGDTPSAATAPVDIAVLIFKKSSFLFPYSPMAVANFPLSVHLLRRKGEYWYISCLLLSPPFFGPPNAVNGFRILTRQGPLNAHKKHGRLCRKARPIHWYHSLPPSFPGHFIFKIKHFHHSSLSWQIEQAYTLLPSSNVLTKPWIF